jgi:hypothetical protein
LLAAILLQVLLRVALEAEHRVASLFKGKSGVKAKFLRFLSARAVLFISKLIILEAINLFFGDSVVFSGAIHGLISFLIVVLTKVAAEQGFSWVYRSQA